MGTIYIVSGLLVYMVLIAMITRVLGQNSVATDRRSTDRRQNTESRRKSQRDGGGACRRLQDRRSMYAGMPA